MTLTPEECAMLTPEEADLLDVAQVAATEPEFLMERSMALLIRDLARTRLALKQEREKTLKLCQSLRDIDAIARKERESADWAIKEAGIGFGSDAQAHRCAQMDWEAWDSVLNIACTSIHEARAAAQPSTAEEAKPWDSAKTTTS